MALGTAAVWEVATGSTSGNLNSGYFNPNNVNMASDLTTDTNTGNTASPVVSSASYNFVASDVGNWLYVKGGVNWISGWYKIASVASNKATLNASIGSAIIADINIGFPNAKYRTNTSAGVSTVGTPTGGFWTVDYSQSTAQNNTTTNDLASSNGTTAPATVTSATYTFGVNTIGNGIHVISGTNWTAGWYEVVSVSGGAATLDRAVGAAASISSGTWYIGGALSMGSTLDGDWFSIVLGGNRIFVKNGTYTLGEAITNASAGTGTAPSIMEGYNLLRGDAPSSANQPTWDCAAFIMTTTSFFDIYYCKVIGSAASTIIIGSSSKYINCFFNNYSTSTGRLAVSLTNTQHNFFQSCAFASYFGNGANMTSGQGNMFQGCVFRDSTAGIACQTGGLFAVNCLFENCTTGCSISGAATQNISIINCTFYGSENKNLTAAITCSSATAIRVTNCIIYGYATGISGSASCFGSFNCYFNNTNDVIGAVKSTSDFSANPNFTNMAQLTGSTATTSTTTLTQSGGNFSTVTDGVDYIRVISGSGVTAGVYPIISHTATTVTSNLTFGTNATANKVWQITTGHNLGVGTNVKGTAYPGSFRDFNTTGYLDNGAAQRQEAGATSSFTFGS